MLLHFVIQHLFATFLICTNVFWLFSWMCYCQSVKLFTISKIESSRGKMYFRRYVDNAWNMIWKFLNIFFFFLNRSHQKYRVVFLFKSISSDYFNDISSHFSALWIHFIFNFSQMIFEMMTFVLTFIFLFATHHLYIVFSRSFWILFRLFAFFGFVNS